VNPAPLAADKPAAQAPNPGPETPHPAIKARLAGGYCLRAEAQGASPYANICEHCPGFRADPSHLAVLAAQRVDARALAAPTLAAGAPKRTGTAGSPSDSTPLIAQAQAG
jgi:hypothetical protein